MQSQGSLEHKINLTIIIRIFTVMTYL